MTFCKLEPVVNKGVVMKDIWEPTLQGRIDNFLNRKDDQFPELDLSHRTHNYRNISPRRSFVIKQPK